MFNIESLALKDTVNLHLKHPVTDELLYADAEETKAVQIVLYGTSSKQYRNAVSAMQSRSLKRGKRPATLDEMREESVRLLVACSDTAINLSYKDEVPSTAEAFRELYSDPAYSWLKDQVDAGLGDISNFLEK
jgi:hypothetical protein